MKGCIGGKEIDPDHAEYAAPTGQPVKRIVIFYPLDDGVVFTALQYGDALVLLIKHGGVDNLDLFGAETELLD